MLVSSLCCQWNSQSVDDYIFAYGKARLLEFELMTLFVREHSMALAYQRFRPPPNMSITLKSKALINNDEFKQIYDITLISLHSFYTDSTNSLEILDMETGTQVSPHDQSPSLRKPLLILSCIVFAIGNCGVPLIMRLYFIHGGNSVWLSSCLQSAGWPFILVILIITLYYRRTTTGDSTAKLFNMKPRLILASIVLGILTGSGNYLYAYGISKLPVSTSVLVVASQLAFTAGFAFLLVKQKFSPFSINAVVLLTVGSGVLALHTNNDRPDGESKREYVMGFVMTLAAAALWGFILPLMELTYQKAKQVIDFPLVMEIQVYINLFATLFGTVGMLINNDFKAIPKEARNFDLGVTKYYTILVCCGILSQFFTIGLGGVIFCASSLLSGIVIAVLLPVTEVLAVLLYKEKFQAQKAVALVLSLWGFVSFFYGEIKHSQKTKESRPAELEVPLNHG
ncbi:putative purine permease [Heracleum sosnowskyi]|uniref:Probable purine permease n=1 Tax=Heracleum sosnowskyi TaxID=360622 RepID=A0AAD8MCD0_9APIA|nr:putative purine permease [Heracleum sosnowskyi]KAK1367053.1 putative purine permease [Heracleum sosnowskyi]